MQLPIYYKSFMTTAVIVVPQSYYQTKLQTNKTINSGDQKQYVTSWHRPRQQQT